MKLKEARRRLPVLGQLPSDKTRGYAPVEGGGDYRPALAVWELTLACDHRCIHCGPRAGEARPDELTTDEALALVDDLAEIGVGEVVLIGGEAYLRNDFILIIRRIRERGMSALDDHRRPRPSPRPGPRPWSRLGSKVREPCPSTASRRAHDKRAQSSPGSWKRGPSRRMAYDPA